MIEVHQFACLSDNYGYLVHDRAAARRCASTRPMPRPAWPQPVRAAGRSRRSGTRTGIPTMPAATWRSRRPPAVRSPRRPAIAPGSRVSTALSMAATP
ncbi:hypothetical protein Lal_00014319 [Lupinus albus]|nr:hypothetical protein Lal_00014319 [Lupinus albus]